MATPTPVPNLKDFIGDMEDPFIIYASGSTPESVVAKLRETIDNINEESRKGLGLIFMLAAVGQRRTIEEALTRPALIPLSRYLMQHWAIRGNINFSGLNMAGNILFAAHAHPGPTIMNNWRSKIGDLSIWHTMLDSPRCKLADKAKQIAKEKVEKFTKEEAIRHGTAVILLLVEGSAAPANPIIAPGGAQATGFFMGGAPQTGSTFQAGMSSTTIPDVAPRPDFSAFEGMTPEVFSAMTAEQHKEMYEKLKAAGKAKLPPFPPAAAAPRGNLDLVISEGKQKGKKIDTRGSEKKRKGEGGEAIDPKDA